MDSDLKQLFSQLTSASSPSGDEADAQNIFLKFIKPYVDEISFDAIGNLIAKRSRGTTHKTIMLMAHADEVGFMIKYIEESGFIRMSKIGGINISSLEGQRVVIHHQGNYVKGIIGQRPIHMKRNNDEKISDISELWVDVGTNSKEETERLVSIGDYVTFEPNFCELPNKFVSKSIDDRVGLLVIAGVLKNLHDVQTINSNIVAVASVQEEIGLRGAKVASYDIKPDISIIIDVTHATDYPTINKGLFGDIQLDSGVVITCGPNFDKQLFSDLICIAENKKLLYQKEVMPFASPTDASAVQISRGGRPTGLISIPCRYMHSPSEIVSENDINSAIALLTNYCINFY